MSACPVRPSSSRLHAVWVCGAARGGGRRIARLGPCQPVCALRASCGDHAAAGAAGRVPPCTSPAGPRVQVSRRGAVREIGDHGPARGSHAVGRARASPGTERAVARARRRPGSGGRGEGGAGRRRSIAFRPDILEPRPWISGDFSVIRALWSVRSISQSQRRIVRETSLALVSIN